LLRIFSSPFYVYDSLAKIQLILSNIFGLNNI